MIEEKCIDDIIHAMDIVEIIENFIPLKKRGNNSVAKCPFHDEKSESFVVSDLKQMYKCFGCGEGGNAFTFMMKFKNWSFPEAVKYAASYYKIPVTETGENKTITPAMIAEIEAGWKLMGEAKRIYHTALMENKEALSYMNGRGFTNETLALWEIGFAPANWRTITDMVIKDNRWDLAVKCSICIETGDKEKGNERNRDYYYNRIMIPIMDENGNCISFGGRIWTEEQKTNNDAKYINGRESFLYDKSATLFGFHKARLIISKAKEAILTEGYLDVIKSHQRGANIVVGSCGTAVTARQAKRLLKVAKNIIIAQDGDKAGVKSAMTAIDSFYEFGGSQINIIEWPEAGMDLDSYLDTIPLDSAQDTPMEATVEQSN